MALENVAHYNDLSDKLRAELEKRIEGYPRFVKYKFDIFQRNPDPEKVNGEFILPGMYNLTPATFRVTDPFEDRKDKPKVKNIGLVMGVDEKGIPDRFFKAKLLSIDRAEWVLDKENVDDLDKIYYAEIHPKNKNSMFPDSSKHPVFELIDEAKYSTEGITERKLKNQAYNIAAGMSEKEVREFAHAMTWDGDIAIDKLGILRDKIEKQAEEDPKLFKDLIESKKVQYLSVIKKAIDNKTVSYSAPDYSFSWIGNGNVIFRTSTTSQLSPNEQFADFLMTNGDKADEIFKRMKEVVK